MRLAAGETASVVLKLWVLAFDKIVVTAGKSGELDAQAVPMAVSVLSGTELERLRATNVEDLAGLAPSVAFSQNTGFAQLTIRGIGTNAVFAVRPELGPGRWTVGLYARNLTDENFITGSFASPPPAVGGRPGPPRQLGIQLTLRR